MRIGRLWLAVLLVMPVGLGVAATLGGRPAEAAPPVLDGVKVIEAWPNVAFGEPIALGHANDGSDTLYVLEQPGILKRATKWRGGTGPVPQPQVVLDLTSTGKIHNQSQGGALGLAFHPQCRTNGRFFLSYLAKSGNATLPFKLVVGEFRLQNGTSSPSSERVVIEVLKTRAQHQAGGLAFGPDGKLYLGIGDNASENDSEGHAQNVGDLLGKILRLDVDAPGRPYAVPADNPLVRNPAAKGEVFAYGFRNPWRFCWDAEGTMFVGEPGSKGADCREWITQVVAGGNHGWPFMEGSLANPKRRDVPPGTRFVPRTYDYGRTDPDAGSCAIGGQVYRGARLPALRGRYVFCDYELGEIYALALTRGADRWTGSDPRKIGDVTHCVSIDTDAQGELYFCVNEKADSGGSVMTLTTK